MSIFDKYPETDFENFNLDWVIRKIKEITKEVSDFVVINRIVWGGLHDPGKEYPRWCIVDTPTHEGYISIQPVPAGVTIDNEDYWRQVANYSALYADFQNRLIALETTIGDASSGLVKDVNDLEAVQSLAGKSVLIIGDSISDESLFPNCWVKNFRTMCSYVNCTITNFSASGRCIGVYGGGTHALVNALPNVPAGQYTDIVMFLGVNDWINQITLGYINDNTPDSVLYNMKVFAQWCATTYPDAKVTIVTPLKAQITGDVRHKLLQFYVRAIVSGALQYGFNVIDAHTFAPLIAIENMSAWLRDGIHPKDEYAPYLSEFILRNLAAETGTVGIEMTTTTEAIGDVGGQSDRVFMDYCGDGNFKIRVTNFNVSTTGTIKLADLLEENKPVNNMYGCGTLTDGAGVSHMILFIANANSVYAIIPSDLPAGTIAGNIYGGYVQYGRTIINMSE